MKTDDLITLLARNAGPAPPAGALHRLAPVALLGFAASAALAHLFLDWIPASMLQTPAPWFKLGYALALAIAALALTARLARPVPRWRAPAAGVAAVVAAVAVVGALAWVAAAPGGRAAAVLGHSWATCPWNVALLSLPALAAALAVVRRLAPTRLRLAGFSAGLMAGAVGAGGYALACTEPALSFVAVWYTLGIAAVAMLGAALGPRVLRW